MSDRRKTLGAARMRRMRARIRTGRAQFVVEVDENGLVKALISAEFLTEAECDRKQLVNAALNGMLESWVERWLKASKGR